MNHLKHEPGMKELKELRKQIKDANGGDTHIFKNIDLED